MVIIDRVLEKILLLILFPMLLVLGKENTKHCDNRRSSEQMKCNNYFLHKLAFTTVIVKHS